MGVTLSREEIYREATGIAAFLRDEAGWVDASRAFPRVGLERLGKAGLLGLTLASPCPEGLGAWGED